MSQIEILSSFGNDGRPVSAAELIDITGLPRSSLFRSLKILIEAGFIYQDPRSKRYMLGVRVLQLGLVARRQLSAEEFIAEPMLELLRRTGETITFSLLDIPWRICAYVLEGPSDLRHVVQLGSRYPLHLGAAGKVILAHLPVDIVRSVLMGQGMNKSEIANLHRELETMRQKGFAITTGERVPGASSVAVPVFVNGSIYGSVAVAGPTDRVLPVLERNRSFVAGLAKKLSDRLSAGQELFASASAGRRLRSSRQE